MKLINKIRAIHPPYLKVVIHDNGNKNVVNIPRQKGNRKARLDIFLFGSNNFIEVGDECQFKRYNHFSIFGDGNKIIIGKSVIFDQQVTLVAAEGTTITIGSDSIFAKGVTIRTSDQHSIFGPDGSRINMAKDVAIGKHVWFGANSTVSKGVHVGDGAVVGLGAIVTKDIPEGCVAAGVPAKVIKTNIRWES